MTALYLAAFAVGALGIVSALFFDFGHGDGLPFLSLTSVSAALLGGAPEGWWPAGPVSVPSAPGSSPRSAQWR